MEKEKQYAFVEANYAPVKGDRGSVLHRWEVTIRYSDSPNRPQDPGEVVVPDFEDSEELEAFLDAMPKEAEETDVIELYAERIVIVQPQGLFYFLDMATPTVTMTVDLPLDKTIYIFEVFTDPARITAHDLETRN